MVGQVNSQRSGDSQAEKEQFHNWLSTGTITPAGRESVNRWQNGERDKERHTKIIGNSREPEYRLAENPLIANQLFTNVARVA